MKNLRRSLCIEVVQPVSTTSRRTSGNAYSCNYSLGGPIQHSLPLIQERIMGSYSKPNNSCGWLAKYVGDNGSNLCGCPSPHNAATLIICAAWVASMSVG